MKNITFPLKFEFKITSLANDFIARDANGRTIAYVRQKLFKFKEDIAIYNDESKTSMNFNIKADRWLDFSAAYSFFDAAGKEIGKIARKGWRSLWKAEYEIVDQNQKIQFHIREENGWVKVLDSLVGEIPILSMFTGYLFNPSYAVTNLQNEIVVRISKEPSFWGRRFTITKLKDIDSDDDERVILGLMMMILLERRRG